MNLVSFAKVGVGPCFEMGLERVSGPAPVGVDTGRNLNSVMTPAARSTTIKLVPR
jgi:hypothetical protein